ncbi:hypothetical protein M5J20_04320 [Corynebacterium sp. TA-R-1]|uniref:Uncharacterized protein n=1 Tax=Corynebacterium stercoris TaxID=2943490 RepID=A0ABT1G077_9CORY|nr:hypothetical protein [Corynebacterium stercoris]MCP1387413.1 hypothetical protein [Corynebacterium stercoris]
MSTRLYPLAPSVWGAAEEITATGVVQALLFAEFGGHVGAAYVDVLLEPHPLTATWRVRRVGPNSAQGPVLGEVPAAKRARFEDTSRIDASLLRPQTTAAIALDPATGKFAVQVLLPPPVLAVPRNDVPADAVVLPPGDMVVVDTARGEYNAELLGARSPGQWFVALHRIGDSVAATLGDKVLGGFDAADAEELGYILEDTAAEAGERPVYARAFLLDGMAGISVAGPEEGLQRVPTLKVPDQRSLSPWRVEEYADGTWGVLVDRGHVMDETEAPKPRHTARYVSLAGGERPEDLAAPTEMFGRVDIPDAELRRGRHAAPEGASGSAVRVAQLVAKQTSASVEPSEGYLTEVEKVRLRRAKRIAGEGGRHRK